jgi:hypothetical protein
LESYGFWMIEGLPWFFETGDTAFRWRYQFGKNKWHRDVILGAQGVDLSHAMSRHFEGV